MRKNSSNTGHAGSKAGPSPGAWHSRGSGAPQSHLLGGCERTSHLQVSRFTPASKITPCWKDADPMTLPETVCPRRYWDLRLSLCSLVLQLTSRKRNNQQTQKCLLVERTTEEGRVQNQQLHAMKKRSSQCRNKVHIWSSHCELGHRPLAWDTQEGRKD